MTSNNRQKGIVLINAVVWSSLYPSDHPLRNVRQWFARWLDDLPQLNLEEISAQDDVLARVQAGLDGVIISGSPQDAWNDEPVNLRLCEVVHECQRRRIPLLGICYGHQILGRALGGKVARHPEGLELGNTPVQLTPAGQASPLFNGFPAEFEVLSSHADAVLEMPPGGQLLVQGDFTLNQGFHWNQLLFGVQFHPETDPDVLRFIWSTRRELWRPKVTFDLDKTLDSLRTAPMAARLLRNFVTEIVP